MGVVQTPAARGIRGAHTERAVAGLDRSAGALGDAQVGRSGHGAGAIALTEVAQSASKHLVQGEVQGLAFDVPEREVNGSDRVNLLSTRRIEGTDVHLLPRKFGFEGIVANNVSGALFQSVFDSAFSHARDADVGLDGDHHVALVERSIPIGRLVDVDARDRCFRQGRAE